MPAPPRPDGQPAVVNQSAGLTFLTDQPLTFVVEIWSGEVRWTFIDRLFARAAYLPEEEGWICEIYSRDESEILWEFGGRTANGAADAVRVAENLGEMVRSLMVIAADRDEPIREMAQAIAGQPPPRFAFQFDGEKVEGGLPGFTGDTS